VNELLFKPAHGEVSISSDKSSARSSTLRGSSERVAKRRDEMLTNSNILPSSPTSSSSSSSSSSTTAHSQYDHLIIVAGHAVLDPAASRNIAGAYTDDAAWLLLSYQKRTGLPDVIIEHIKAGITLSASLPNSLLIFSGGETRKSSGPLSEAASYFTVADALSMFPPPHDDADGNIDRRSNDNNDKDEDYIDNKNNDDNNDSNNKNKRLEAVRERTYTEEYATDSYENLLYSVCRFHEVAGVYPKDITVISFTFK
jgi:hypothetical protein